uniref:Uncharacterized protein n=1 Tax=Equus asinus asinus TaxID=83772 RepID=A0A8C4LL32_EQUAS
MTAQRTLRGTLKGHNGCVIQITPTPQFPDMILSTWQRCRQIQQRSRAPAPQCTSPACSADGRMLFADYTDNLVWNISEGGRGRQYS